MTHIVLPVFNAANALRRCLDSLCATLTAKQALTIVDDASTDAQIGPLLAEFCQRDGVTLHHNPSNLGFVRSVNATLAEVASDVVLLNSDTIATRGWFEAIERCANSDLRIATITPFSNNAEICSLPAFCRNNPPPADPDAVAAAIHACAPPSYPELPTGVGFCMFIRGQAWRDVGGFDEAFGVGYGEENDFCRRAARAGWRNVLCDDAYVVHLGGQSFAERGLKPGGDNMARLLERHPDYAELVERFIAADPLAARRAEIADELKARKIVAPSG